MSQARPVSRRKFLQTSLVAAAGVDVALLRSGACVRRQRADRSRLRGREESRDGDLKKFLSNSGKALRLGGIVRRRSQVLAAASDLTRSRSKAGRAFGDYRTNCFERQYISTPS